MVERKAFQLLAGVTLFTSTALGGAAAAEAFAAHHLDTIAEIYERPYAGSHGLSVSESGQQTASVLHEKADLLRGFRNVHAGSAAGELVLLAAVYAGFRRPDETEPSAAVSPAQAV
ncbi:MAG TPA: hypothetical protein VM124_03785 [Candidatus Limnocylindrales bacterium]|nr:hypothetical protein [Candidatus Limnocylindrales bacterium]